MSDKITGGCLCGAVRYEFAAEPMFPGYCHCRQCQKRSGSGHATAFAIPAASLQITGEVKRYASTADSGNTVQHGFCPECGSTVTGNSTGIPDLAVIHAGSLDNPSVFKPSMHVYAATAQPWDPIHDDLPRFDAMPPMPES